MVDWVVLELTSRCDRDPPGTIVASLQRDLRGAEVFLPSAESKLGGDVVTHHLMEGYAFASHVLPDARYTRLKDSRYVQNPLFVPGTRRLALVGQSEVDRIKGLLSDYVNQGIAIGDTVQVTAGPYKHLTAVVIEEIPEEDSVQVYVKLRSKQALITLPRSLLKVVSQTPYSKYYVRLSALKAWSEEALRVSEFMIPSSVLVSVATKRVEALWAWHQQLVSLQAFDKVLSGSSQEVLVDRLEYISRLQDWRVRGSRLFSLVAYMLAGFTDRTRIMQENIDEAARLDALLNHLTDLEEEVALLERVEARESKGEVFDNVLVDGFNLAYRCYYSPGFAKLTSSEGKPTGTIYGFLSSLQALRKRFTTAKLWVVWDGSNQRRKAICDTYKGTRPSGGSEAADVFGWQVQFLKACLTALGIAQAWNPEEEADDVIGSLVQGPLVSQCNLIFSSDRDFCQLVTTTTHLLHPSVGARREIFVVGDAGVQGMFGVSAEQVPHLRAFSGDASDNIIGVPRVPKRVLAALIQQYGTVDGVYKSSLTGLTKSQYERIRAFEPQARLNLILTKIVNVQYSVDSAPFDTEQARALLGSVTIDPTGPLAVLGS